MVSFFHLTVRNYYFHYVVLFLKKRALGTSLAVQWLRFNAITAGDAGSIPGPGAKTPHALGPKNQNMKQKQYCNKFSKGF